VPYALFERLPNRSGGEVFVQLCHGVVELINADPRHLHNQVYALQSAAKLALAGRLHWLAYYKFEKRSLPLGNQLHSYSQMHAAVSSASWLCVRS
jgi:hypothetical protein